MGIADHLTLLGLFFIMHIQSNSLRHCIAALHKSRNIILNCQQVLTLLNNQKKMLLAIIFIVFCEFGTIFLLKEKKKGGGWLA